VLGTSAVHFMLIKLVLFHGNHTSPLGAVVVSLSLLR